MPTAIGDREIYRIIDANLNRAREGLRVVEEVARFVLEERTLQKRTKSLRHELASLFAHPSTRKRLAVSFGNVAEGVDRGLLIDRGRDASGDVGKKTFAPGEVRRASDTDIIQANFARIEESVRALEEFTKFLSAELSSRLKAMRFQVYSLEKEYVRAAYRADNARSLKQIGLYPIIDRETIGDRDPLEVAQKLLPRGVKIVQYRDKVSSAAEMCKVCLRLRDITLRKKVMFIVNDRVDIAQASGADGVHLGQDDVPVDLARKLLGSQKIIGRSTHSLGQARQATKEDIDYIAVGPIFSTDTKRGGRPVGPELVTRVKRITDKPIIAIGGINTANLDEVLDKGADGAAVISAILKAKNLRAAAVSLKEVCLTRLRDSR
jgi:thiamine-phosphate pyrophosphorylase